MLPPESINLIGKTPSNIQPGGTFPSILSGLLIIEPATGMVIWGSSTLVISVEVGKAAEVG